jgi:hypothetical protein
MIISFFERLRLPKAHAFASPIICDKVNSSAFECSADNRDLPFNGLRSANRCHSHL